MRLTTFRCSAAVERRSPIHFRVGAGIESQGNVASASKRAFPTNRRKVHSTTYRVIDDGQAWNKARLWIHGSIADFTAGVSYLLSKQISFAVDLFYTPWWVQLNAGTPAH